MYHEKMVNRPRDVTEVIVLAPIAVNNLENP